MKEGGEAGGDEGDNDLVFAQRLVDGGAEDELRDQQQGGREGKGASVSGCMLACLMYAMHCCAMLAAA